ncbi:hypothetical protein SAMN02745751_00696 [Dethiosulfatibacter aminovorans DSM 17477]|uniref:Cof subfamily of IIB subfamily of haloacid dehalogenase superfamily/HAD-superfamily hydrolase, subfamily IIB n=1 Tax=Dethiosulfatibacter aminovorans DSM 17477 TaxID=1121476 RepID=A0A1M6CVY7_9FIRM|nr:HAD-IIB family hydrolase [Dethiosulfatibacter aminovorans]SHI65177.1 hypothetical protein SAMN02745751_00696 [Dethiosulfatibacter aminovorans DSM 17477]
MKFELIALDLDGTLLNREKKIDLITADYLKKLKNDDVDIIIATGRSHFDAVKLTENLDFDFDIISNNGSVTRKGQNHERINSCYIKNDDFQKLVEKSREYDLHPIVYVDKFEDDFDIVIEQKRDFSAYNGYMCKAERRFRRMDFRQYCDDDILSVCYAGNIEELTNLKNSIINLYPSTYNTVTSINLSVNALLEFLDIRGCKWEALKSYCNYKGIDIRNVASFGDDNNDLEMIMNSGLGIVMSNGTKKLKDNGNRVTEFSNDRNGVYHELVKLFGEING